MKAEGFTQDQQKKFFFYIRRAYLSAVESDLSRPKLRLDAADKKLIDLAVYVVFFFYLRADFVSLYTRLYYSPRSFQPFQHRVKNLEHTNTNARTTGTQRRYVEGKLERG
tara:strand:+ start:123 stop:452 length:330 start_codon:yes stop_codon:yes gene_type:complete